MLLAELKEKYQLDDTANHEPNPACSCGGSGEKLRKPWSGCPGEVIACDCLFGHPILDGANENTGPTLEVGKWYRRKDGATQRRSDAKDRPVRADVEWAQLQG